MYKATDHVHYTPVGWHEIRQKVIPQVGVYEPGSTKPSVSPSCDMDDPSKIFYNSFRDGVYRSFCDAVKKDAKKGLKQHVDGRGMEIPKKLKPRSSIQARTPPPDDDMKTGCTFDLQWSGGDGSCASGCIESFDLMTTSPCAHLGGKQNYMANSGKLDTGCGIYSYEIFGPPQPGPVVCKPNSHHDKPFEGTRPFSDSECFQDVHAESVKKAAAGIGDFIPNQSGGHRVDSTMKNVTKFYREGHGTKGVTYMVNIGWIPGCSEYKTMVVDNPQGKSGDTPDQSISATDILFNTYDSCKCLSCSS